jgi:hypothetical protein
MSDLPSKPQARCDRACKIVGHTLRPRSSAMGRSGRHPKGSRTKAKGYVGSSGWHRKRKVSDIVEAPLCLAHRRSRESAISPRVVPHIKSPCQVGRMQLRPVLSQNTCARFSESNLSGLPSQVCLHRLCLWNAGPSKHRGIRKVSFPVVLSHGSASQHQTHTRLPEPLDMPRGPRWPLGSRRSQRGRHRFVGT